MAVRSDPLGNPEQREARARLDGDTVFLVAVYIILSVVAVVAAYPLVYVVSASFSSPLALVSGRVWLLPVEPTIDAYIHVYENQSIWMGYRNTVFYTVVGTTINVILTILAAYPLSRRDLKGRGALMMVIVFTMFFRGGLIPEYLVVRSLGMVNTVWAMLIPNAIIAFNVIVMRTFFQTNIPDELRDSAFMDGATNTRFLISVVLPLSGPAIAVIILFYAVFHWNSFFQALIYLSNRQLYPLQLVLRQILIQTQVDEMVGSDAGFTERVLRGEALKYAVIIVASLPMLMLYPFIQRFFVKGVMIGALKG
ncbi:MAG: carbohydrate ABC transporter permease [Spirochaetaceae bacterium]|nr:MAG: carbohydrate ABC transporter permease [Spirochaetaceae bacterium]